jgi:hypothetical protein
MDKRDSENAGIMATYTRPRTPETDGKRTFATELQGIYLEGLLEAITDRSIALRCTRRSVPTYRL